MPSQTPPLLMRQGFFHGIMKLSCIILASLTVSSWATSKVEQQQQLYKLFGNMMKNKYPLAETYFTIREAGAPNTSTLYRFNLTNGKMWNIGHQLMPKYNEQTCRVKKGGVDEIAKCEFNIKNTMVTYDGMLSYGSKIVENFTVYASVTEFLFGNHRNPASLTAIVYNRPGCAYQTKCLIVQCLITNFLLDTTTFPEFTKFDFENFKNNSTLANLVWEDFEVNMFTKVRLIVMRTINYTCWERLWNISEQTVR
ncbi:uncharacterized protein LOC142592798 isoform X1 [Dermacentor variabilis]|uniref:uncharacterized protein LOC142592798 isoform X1 n=1 Tax=Dermacentor variabilis TaxID=34621 RepID=UPI003F5C21D5